MNVEQLIDGVIGREGGFVNDPNDAGGATRWGVTQRQARAHGYQGAMRDYPREAAVALYRDTFWTAPGFDGVAALSWPVAAEMFDTGVNMGPPVAVGFLQRALNVLNRGGADYADLACDNRVGPSTLAALKAYLAKRGGLGEVVLVRAMNCLQGARYILLAESRPANEAFEYGWLANRIGGVS